MRRRNRWVGLFLLGAVLSLPAHAVGPDAFPSPNGAYVLKIVANKGEAQSYRVEFREARTDRLCRIYDPKARACEAFWNGSSSMVALNEDLSHSTGAMSLWKIMNGKFKRLALPEALLDRNVPLADRSGSITEEVIERYVATGDRKNMMYWVGSHQPGVHRWINDTDLEIDLSGEAVLKGSRELSLQVRFVVRIVGDKVLLRDVQPLTYTLSAMNK